MAVVSSPSCETQCGKKVFPERERGKTEGTSLIDLISK